MRLFLILILLLILIQYGLNHLWSDTRLPHWATLSQSPLYSLLSWQFQWF